MTFSIYDAIVPSWLQMLGSLLGLLDKAEAWCAEHGVAESDLLEARLADDMLPFAYQVKSCAVHSHGAIEGVRRGEFAPDTTTPPATIAALRTRIEEARAAIAGLDRKALEELCSGDVTFVFNGKRLMEFTGDKFLLSFSQPNFFFHTSTAYAILRARGVPVGKRDYLGAVQIKG